MIDYLIIGSGLAGIAFAETAMHNNKSILVIDNEIPGASNVSGGLYNPVVLKRFTPLAHAADHIKLLDEFYAGLESQLSSKLDYKMPVLRRFSSVEEQNNWFIAADKIGMSPFLSTDLVTTKYRGIDSPFDYGSVNHTGYIDVSALLELYRKYLKNKKLLHTETFSHNLIEMIPDGVQYKNIKARHIIFAEGFKMHANPFFDRLPLDGAKGELLVIKSTELNLDAILNASIFILPLGNDLFKVGATYNWTDKTNIPTEAAKFELLEKLKDVIDCDFEVVDHYAGIRPTVKDRKPLIGTHPNFPRLHILNGLGTRGVILAPPMAKTLFAHIEYAEPIPPEINIKRFEKK